MKANKISCLTMCTFSFDNFDSIIDFKNIVKEEQGSKKR